jgi:hypothetical protein
MRPRLAHCAAAWALLATGCPQFQSDFVVASEAEALPASDSEPQGQSLEAAVTASPADGAASDATTAPDVATSDGAGQDAGLVPDAGSCSAGSLQCSGSQPRVCSSGQWHNVGGPCSNQACVAGACVGVCVPGAVQCAGPTVDGGSFANDSTDTQTCDPTGQWGAPTPCSQPTPVCQAGSCTCPNSSVCNSACADESHDSNNCGACAKTCASGYSCQGGGCAPSCQCSAATLGTACASADCAQPVHGTGATCENFPPYGVTCVGP